MAPELIRVERAAADGPFVLLCDHASPTIPAALGGLGLAADHAVEHIAWDIGALPLAQRLSAELDSPLAYPTISRLVIDCNRAPGHPELFVAETEFGPVPGNCGLDDTEARRRLAEVHARYHDAVERLLTDRRARRRPTLVIGIHSFTPVFRGVPRPWHVGLLYRGGDRLARTIADALASEPGIAVGFNVPYSAEEGDVFYTLARHAEDAGLAGLMIEVRNDLLRDDAGQELWARRLAAALRRAADLARRPGDEERSA